MTAARHLVVERRWRGARPWRIRRRWSLALLAAEVVLFAISLINAGFPPWSTSPLLVCAAALGWGVLGAPSLALRRFLVASERIRIEDGHLLWSTRWSCRRVATAAITRVELVVPILRDAHLVIATNQRAFARPIRIGRSLGLSLAELVTFRRDLLDALSMPGRSEVTPPTGVAAGAGAVDLVLPASAAWGWHALFLLGGLAIAGFVGVEDLGSSPRGLQAAAAFALPCLHITAEVWRGTLHRIRLGPGGLEVLGRFRSLELPLRLLDRVSMLERAHAPIEYDSLGVARNGFDARYLRPIGDPAVVNRGFRLCFWIGGLPLEVPIDRGNREETVRALVEQLGAALAAHRAAAAEAADAGAAA